MKILTIFIIFLTCLGLYIGDYYTRSTNNIISIYQNNNRKLIVENQKLEKEIKRMQNSINAQKRTIKTLQEDRVVISGVANTNQYRKLFKTILEDSKIFDKKEIDQYVELLLMTAQVESNFGNLVKQKNGPALGWFQMEPTTEKDIYENYLKYNKKILEVVENYKHKQNIKGVSELQTNIAYSVIMCAIHYKRYSKKFKLPQIDDRTGQAQIWKKYYNTMHGKGTIEKAVSKSIALK